MVGFSNTWQNTGDNRWLEYSWHSWNFVKNLSWVNGGEWRWGVHQDYSPLPENKVGIRECPYHDSRASMEIIRRLSGSAEQ